MRRIFLNKIFKISECQLVITVMIMVFHFSTSQTPRFVLSIKQKNARIMNKREKDYQIATGKLSPQIKNNIFRTINLYSKEIHITKSTFR